MKAVSLALAFAAATLPFSVSPAAHAQAADSAAETVGTNRRPDDLDRVRDLYRETDFVGCARSARALLDRGTASMSDDAADELWTYLAACLIRSGDVPGGDAVFEQGVRSALQVNRFFKPPDPLVFPESVTERYAAVNRKLEKTTKDKWAAQQKAEAQRQRELELDLERHWMLYDLATQERVTQRNRRWIAAVPFGVGQFQNGDRVLGGVFLVSETLALTGIIAGLSWQLELDRRIHLKQGKVEDNEGVTSRLRAAETLWISSLYGFLGLAVLGILEAELSFVPERTEMQPRPVPDELRPKKPRPAAAGLRPLLVPTNRGALLGLSGRF